MKATIALLLIVLILSSNGCMTYMSVQRASGRDGEWVGIQPSDQVIRNDGTNCVIRRITSSGKTNEISIHLVASDGGYVRKPGFYALLPLTIPADIATSPLQLLWVILWAGEGEC